MKHIVLVCLIALSFGCKDECKNKETFTVKFNIRNGSTGSVYFNLPVMLRNETSDGQNFDVLDTKNTDSFGNVTLNYRVSSCDHLKLSIYSDVYYSEELPSRLNFSDTVYASTYGKLQVYLNTTTLLNPDTLFLWHTYSKGAVQSENIDTIYNFGNGLYKTLVYKLGHNARFTYGRGIVNFNKKMNSGNYKEIKITGDPIIDKYTINY